MRAWNVDDWNDAADHDWKLRQSGCGELIRSERLVGRSEHDRGRLDLRDSTAGPDRLIIDLVAAHLFVIARPLGEDRKHEG